MPVLELAEQNGLSKLIIEHVDLPSTRVASGAMNPAGKLTSIIAAMMCGADSIDDANLLCAGGTPRVFDEVYAARHVRVTAEAGADAGVKIGSLIAGMIAAWLEIIMAATDLIARAKLFGFTDHPELARCEIATFRYRVLNVAARITCGARQPRLRIDSTWRWAQAIATARRRIRTTFT